MRYSQIGIAVLALVLSVASASAATKHAKAAAGMSMSRFSAIMACSEQAQSQYPGTGGDSLTNSRDRMFAYVSCIRGKGFAP